MHIEVGVIQEAKMILSYGTAIASFGYLAKQVWSASQEKGWLSLVLRSLIASLLVLMFFEVFPHQPVGVSEVHLILGSTLFLLFGLVPTGIALMLGLLIQGLFFAPFDLPNYTVNITTLLVPLFVMAALAKRIIPQNIAYKDLAYSQVLKLSLAYQGGIVTWVVFWAIYGQGFASENLISVATFAAAYMSIVVLEPLVDLIVLAGVKVVSGLKDSQWVSTRLYN